MKFKSSGWRIAIIFIVIALLAVGLYFMMPSVLSLLGWLVGLFLPFLLGYLFSLMINPLADKLQLKLKLPRAISAILVIILTVGAVGGILTAIIWKIVEEMRSLYSQYPQIYHNAVDLWQSLSAKFSNFYIAMPDSIQEMFDNLGVQISAGVAAFFSQTPFVTWTGNFAKGLPGVFIGLIVFFLSLYFMVSDSKRVNLAIKNAMPDGYLEKMAGIRNELKRYLGGYVKAQAIIMSIAFVVLFIGLSILHVSYAFLIALGIAFLDALPFFGSGAVLWPWVLISFVNGDVKMGVGLLIIYLIVILMRQTIEPKIVSSNIGVHPILTLMSMYIGYKSFSIGGVILGPVTLMLIISFYKAGIFAPLIRLLKRIGIMIKNEYLHIKSIFFPVE